MRLVRSKKTWLSMAAIAAVASIVWCAWVIIEGNDEEDDTTVVGLATATTVAPTPLPKPPMAPVEPALPTSIVIPSIDVDAPISVKGMAPGGVMQPPNGPEDVTWYNFTARPSASGARKTYTPASRADANSPNKPAASATSTRARNAGVASCRTSGSQRAGRQ